MNRVLLSFGLGASLALTTQAAKAAAQFRSGYQLAEPASSWFLGQDLSAGHRAEVSRACTLALQRMRGHFLKDFLPAPASRASCEQAEPLQVYDDFGVPITLPEIDARTRSGQGWGVLGAILGGSLGFVVGGLIAFEQCGIFESCSPREDAMASVAFLGGIAWGLAGGVAIATRASRIDRWEALALIRAERRQSRLAPVR